MLAAPHERCEVEKMSSKRAAAMGDAKILEKAMNLAAKKNSLEPGNCLSFPSISDSTIATRIANVGVSLGRDDSVILSSITSIKNLEIDRFNVSAKCNSNNKSTSPKINLDEDMLEEVYDHICSDLVATPRRKKNPILEK